MALERTLAVAVLYGKRARRNHLQSLFGACRGGFVQDDRHRLRGVGLGVRAELDFLGADLEVRLLDDLAVHSDPATLDKQFGLPAGATDQLDEAFGKANGVCHDKKAVC